jgi:hypothetical protein
VGKTKGSYNEEYPVGKTVRIVDKEQLESFFREWKYHHPLQPLQLQYAGRVARVANVMFYHGGDELYELVDVPGIWHEECLVGELDAQV